MKKGNSKRRSLHTNECPKNIYAIYILSWKNYPPTKNEKGVPYPEVNSAQI